VVAVGVWLRGPVLPLLVAQQWAVPLQLKTVRRFNVTSMTDS